MNLHPKYLSFFTRVWVQVNRTILLFTVIIIPVILINGTNILYGILLGLVPVTILLLVRSFIVSRYYLKSLEINEDKKYILLEIVKYNKNPEQYKISLEDANVKINQVLYSFGPYYKLEFYKNKDMVFQQRECKGWPRSILVEIYDKIKKLKGQYSHKEWVKRKMK